MAHSGFIFIGREDNVQCAYCGCIIGGWEEGDSPLEEHKKENASCEFVIDQTDQQQPMPEEDVKVTEKTEDQNNHDKSEDNKNIEKKEGKNNDEDENTKDENAIKIHRRVIFERFSKNVWCYLPQKVVFFWFLGGVFGWILGNYLHFSLFANKRTKN